MIPKFIFWDVGDTLILNNIELTLKRLARLTGNTSEVVRRRISESNGTHVSIFDSAALGFIGTQKFIRRVRRRLKIDTRLISNDLILRVFLGRYELGREVCHLLYYLGGQGYTRKPELGELERIHVPMGVISNTEVLSWRHIEDTFPVFRIQTGVFQTYTLSCKEGMKKPQREMYARAFGGARKLVGNDLTPHDCLFYDDKLENIISAQVFGFRAVKVERAGDAKIFDTLDELRVPLPPPDFSPPRYQLPSEGKLYKESYKFERVV